MFVVLLLLPIFGIPAWNFILNPHNRYRADSASSTAHTIYIDEHYQVSTTAASTSVLTYTEDPQAVIPNKKDISHAVDRINWNDDYIIISGKRSDENESFMIINRNTVKTTGYPNKKEFEEGKKEKGIELSPKSKRAFDWY